MEGWNYGILGLTLKLGVSITPLRFVAVTLGSGVSITPYNTRWQTSDCGPTPAAGQAVRLILPHPLQPCKDYLILIPVHVFNTLELKFCGLKSH
jgi:hypothetical protein